MCPNCYRCPSTSAPNDMQTTYVAVLSPKSYLQAQKSYQLGDLSGSASQHLLVLEVDKSQSVHWMSPEDCTTAQVVQSFKTPYPPHVNGVNSVFADGAVRFLSQSMPEDVLRSLLMGESPKSNLLIHNRLHQKTACSGGFCCVFSRFLIPVNALKNHEGHKPTPPSCQHVVGGRFDAEHLPQATP